MRALSDHEWAQVVARAAPASFFIGVVTTGIFCRVGCPARTPKRENVRFFAAAAEASSAGFRPCLRCKPLGTDPFLQPVIDVARAIESDPQETWDGAALGAVSGLAPRTLRERFRSVLGISPKAFRDAVRLRRFKSALKSGARVTDAEIDAGYSGSAQRHAAAAHLGMTPTAYRNGGAEHVIEYIVAPTALGHMLLAATAKGICVLQFLDEGDDAEARLHAEFPDATLVAASPDAAVEHFAREVAAFLAEGGPRPDLPVDLQGTAFQQKVWSALQAIPRGETTTYAQLATEIGKPGAARAVGNANGKNTVAVIVPCHLVVAAGGKLGGYAGGLDRKRKLLALELGSPFEGG